MDQMEIKPIPDIKPPVLATWNAIKETTVIEFYKANPCLWQHGDPDRNNKLVHFELLENLQGILDQEYTIKEIKCKWRKLKDIFDRCVKKARLSDGQYGVTWHHFDRMLPFLSNDDSDNLFDSSHSQSRNEITHSQQTGSPPSTAANSSNGSDNTQPDLPTYILVETNNQNSTASASSSPISVTPKPQNDSQANRPGIKREASECNNTENGTGPHAKTKQFIKRLKSKTSQPDCSCTCTCQETITSDDYFGRHIGLTLKSFPLLMKEQAKLDLQRVLLCYIEKMKADCPHIPTTNGDS